MEATITSAKHKELARKKLLEREENVRRENAKLAQRASCDAEAIIAFIASHYRPSRIYQWGSLLRPGAFRSFSDIDIAIEGIVDAERFFALLGDVEKLTHFPLDIVQLEKIEPEYADDIRRNGKLVYECA